MNLEDYIKDLPAELQEKARACGSVEELLALAKEAKVPLPDEALTAIAGGDDVESGGCKDKMRCPKCGSTDVKEIGFFDGITFFKCNKCGTHFEFPF